MNEIQEQLMDLYTKWYNSFMSDKEFAASIGISVECLQAMVKQGEDLHDKQL